MKVKKIALSGVLVALAILASAVAALLFAVEVEEEEMISAVVERGRQLTLQFGCTACHATTGEVSDRPTFTGLFGSKRTLTTGKTIIAYEAYLRESILDPTAKVVQGFIPNLMPDFGNKLLEQDLDTIIAYIKSLSASKVGQGIDELIKALQDDEDAGVRAEAAFALGAIGPEAQEVVPVLAEALRDEDEFVRFGAAFALVEIGPAAVPALVETLRDEDAGVREEAAFVLGEIGSAAVPVLVEALQDEDVLVRATAAEALEKIGPDAKDAVPALIEALQDEDWRVRTNVAWALGNIGLAARDAVSALVQALQDADEHVRRAATEALKKIDPDVGPALTKVLRDAETFYNRGVTYLNQGEYERAISSFNQAIELIPRYTEAHVSRGSAYLLKGEYDRAISDFDKAIGLEPGTAEAYLGRGLAYSKQGEYGRAIADYTQTIELIPEDTMVYLIRGIAYKNKGEYDRASTDVTQATQAANETNDAFSNDFICWFGSIDGFAEIVLPACEHAVELAPDNGAIRDSRGLARALTGDIEGAIEDFQCYVEWSKENNLYEPYGRRREAWIAGLEMGRNPFDLTTLEELRNE
ncbi:MAG: HEAT repeat domain-containing protein [Candidatus Bipolaricaulia bacterium]